MNKRFLTIIAIVVGAVYLQTLVRGPVFVAPAAAVGNRSDSGIKKYEFAELFKQNKPFSKLAKKDYYTVIEGYIDSCSICKSLEADFTPFLRQRKDVLIRRVHYQERQSVSFNSNSKEEAEQKMTDYYERRGRYNDFDAFRTDDGYMSKHCGTPHIEIYGPDKQLIATDKCGEKYLKTGLVFLRNWIKAE